MSQFVEIKDIFYTLIKNLKKIQNIRTYHSLTVSTSILTSGFVVDSCTAGLVGSVLNVQIQWHKTSTLGMGNINNITPIQITVAHQNRFTDYGNVSGWSGASTGPVISYGTLGASINSTNFIFKLGIFAIGKSGSATAIAANTKMTTQLNIPVKINPEAFAND